MYLHLGQDYIVPLQSVVGGVRYGHGDRIQAHALLLERLQDEDGSSSCTTICARGCAVRKRPR
mgnify:CR=1 FL=1